MRLERLAAYAVDPSVAPEVDEALEALVSAERVGFGRLLEEHCDAWDARWRDADVRIEGDPELQRDVRFALFHLMASAPDDGEAALGARGLSGLAYGGHVFWDADVFVLPFLAATHPASARAMIRYRANRLPAARQAARQRGLDGARFPWESAREGHDVTPRDASGPDGVRIPILTGAFEEHIVADVAWAVDRYLAWTGDRELGQGDGRSILAETARYWASRIRISPDGRGHIDDVIGPDEYHERVDDNAFTNVMARWNLRRAAACGGLPEHETARWRWLADALVDGYEAATAVYEQFAGFFDLEPLLISELSRVPVAADVLLGRERTAGAQVVKQPDVLMLHLLAPDEVAPGSLGPNLDFYGPRTAHGSSLSLPVHAALLARAGRADEAAAALRLATRIDIDDVYGATAGGLHLAAMGGVWQALASGFAGIRPAGSALALDPVLPGCWDALELRLLFRESRVRIRVEPDAVIVHADPGVPIRVGSDPRPLVAAPRGTEVGHRSR
jgi:trehalose/maltose hydrolase-like predicted phosphorylase